MNTVLIVMILAINFALLLTGYYLLNAYLYFSSTCMRQEKKKGKADLETELPPNYELLWINGAPGKLTGYYRRGSKNKLVILVHGWMDDAYSRLDDVDFYKNIGFHIFLPDLRAHGKSEGKYMGMGIADSVDLKEWVNYFKDKLGSHTEIVLDGVSFGAAAVLHMEPAFLNENVTAIVSDSSYESLIPMFRKMIHFSPKFMAGIYLYGIRFFCRMLGKFDIKQNSIEENMRQIAIPVLLIGGALDKLVPVDTQHRLQAACQGSCSLWIEEQASHAKAAYVNREAYNNTLSSFLCMD